MASVKNLKTQIISEVTAVTKLALFTEWFKKETISQKNNHFVAINNSLIFREQIKTVKNKQYIAFDVSITKTFDTKKIYIVEGIRFNSQFKLYTTTPNLTKTTLEDAIKYELKNIGEIIYSIVGDIQDINDISENLENINFKKITLSPTLSIDFQVTGNEIQIKDYGDREQIWTKIETHCKTNTLNIADNLQNLIDGAITNLQNNAFSTLSLPKKFNIGTKYLLDKISTVIEEHINTYKENINKVDNDPKAMNEILRVSYNFVSDVNKLLTFIINLCDLKPIIYWLTISKHFKRVQREK